MNYQRIYDNLVFKGKNRTLTGYKEKHHIIPRCMGGSDDIENLVNLTPEEHFLAHQLLIKIYPDVPGLAYAILIMSKSSQYNGRVNNKMFGWLRRKVADANSKRFKGKTRPPRSKEWCDKISASRIGVSTITEQGRERLRQIHIGKKKSVEACEKYSNYAKNRSKEHQHKLNESNRGKPKSNETKEKIKNALRNLEVVTCPHCGKTGKPNGMKCHHFDRCKHNPDRILPLQLDITCPHCGKTGKPRGMNAWHFDKCKENPNVLQRQISTKK